jgi:trimeric autotransporter adhesin
MGTDGGGTVTSVSVVSANGLAGTVATATTTPAITLSTTVTGLLKGNGTAISAATSGTDYAPATSGTSILYGNGSGGFSNVTIGTGVAFAGGTLSATGSGGTVTSVTGTAPVVSSGGATPAISMAAATTSVNGYLTSTDWNTFKQPSAVSNIYSGWR